MGNCFTLLKRVCCVQYNLSHHSLKVIIAFEQSCGVLLCQNPFPSPLCVFFYKKKKKKGNCPTLLKRVCCVQYNLPYPSLKVNMAFEWCCGGLRVRTPFHLSCVCVCAFVSQKKKEWVIDAVQACRSRICDTQLLQLFHET